MYWYGHDPQTEKGHPCEVCGCECFGDPVCRRCAERMQENGNACGDIVGRGHGHADRYRKVSGSSSRAKVATGSAGLLQSAANHKCL